MKACEGHTNHSQQFPKQEEKEKKNTKRFLFKYFIRYVNADVSLFFHF